MKYISGISQFGLCFFFRLIHRQHCERHESVISQQAKNGISIRVFHWVCQFWYFTSVSILVFTPSPLRNTGLMSQKLFFVLLKKLKLLWLSTSGVSGSRVWKFVVGRRQIRTLPADFNGTCLLQTERIKRGKIDVSSFLHFF